MAEDQGEDREARAEDPEVLAYLAAENRYFEAMMAPHQALVDELFAEIKVRQKLEIGRAHV